MYVLREYLNQNPIIRCTKLAVEDRFGCALLLEFVTIRYQMLSCICVKI